MDSGQWHGLIYSCFSFCLFLYFFTFLRLYAGTYAENTHQFCIVCFPFYFLATFSVKVAGLFAKNVETVGKRTCVRVTRTNSTKQLTILDTLVLFSLDNFWLTILYSWAYWIQTWRNEKFWIFFLPPKICMIL